MFRSTMYNCLKRLGVTAAVLVTVCCSHSALYDIDENELLEEGYIAIDLSLSADTRATLLSNGEYTENEVNTLDFFFYEANAGESEAAVYVTRITVNESTLVTDQKKKNTVKVPFDFKNCTKSAYRAIGVANWHDKSDNNPDMPENPTIAALKALITKADAKNGDNDEADYAFRSDHAPANFVMTNLSQKTTENRIGAAVTINTDQKTGSGKVSLTRVAAKIRVALEVVESIQDGDRTWTPDFDNMKLFINNGVRKARLDGGETDLTYSADDLETNDYYNIQTQGSRETEDYKFSRTLKEHNGGNLLTGLLDPDYKYFNELPLYTYPHVWNESVTENHPTTLTIVVPWEHKENGKTTTYQPTYYTIHVNDEYTIESNKYYYIRLHIGMMGSVTPEKPMEVDMECTIADWGQAKETGVDIRPIRYLIFNQREFTMNNTPDIEIPFSSTHRCIIEKVEVSYYSYTGDYGETKTLSVDPSTSNALVIKEKSGNSKYTCTLDNNDKIVSFHQEFNDAGTYSPYDVTITVRHSDQSSGSEYTSQILIHVFPAIYITSEMVGNESVYRLGDGSILINGYGNTVAGTGNLGQIRTTTGTSTSDKGDTRALYTFTITQLNDDDRKTWGWEIDDPRTYYINNDLDDKSVATDYVNNFTTWKQGTNGRNGGPYDGTQLSGGTSTFYSDRHQNATYASKIIWDWYTGEDWTIDYVDEQGETKTWSAKDDKERVTLRYYYPASSFTERENQIAPQFTIVTVHARSADSDDTGATGCRRRCAAYQQYGYPAGRWRLPTYGELRFIKKMQGAGIIQDVFRGGDNQSATGSVNSNGNKTTGTGFVRCVYDNWYWERYDRNGNTLNRIPKTPQLYDGVDNWKIFVWGDRPKENPETTTRANGKGYTVQDFLQEKTPSNYAVIRDVDGVKLKKFENN